MAPSEIGFDFAVTEGCPTYDECDSSLAAYGEHVLQIEYTDTLEEPFGGVCASTHRAPLTILRDRELATPASAGYVYRSC